MGASLRTSAMSMVLFTRSVKLHKPQTPEPHVHIHPERWNPKIPPQKGEFSPSPSPRVFAEVGNGLIQQMPETWACEGFGFRVKNLWGLGFRVKGLGFRV